MSRFLVSVLLTLGLCSPAAGDGGHAPLVERAWLDVSSENFRIRSVLGEERTVELLRHLEIMRASLDDPLGEPTYHAQVPTIILAVDRHDDYVSIGAPAYSAGYFYSNMRENAILIEDSNDATGVQVILHEYAHYLNKQSGRIRFPRWFEEGNAEYLSHSRVRDQAFEYGMAAKRHLSTLNFMSWSPLADILERDDTSSLGDEEAALFYGQSWLLVHYLQSLPGAQQSLDRSLQRYARLASDGTPPTAAFERAFAVELDQFERDLLQYYLNKSFPSRIVPVNTALPGFSPRVRTLSPAEAQLALAQMALRFDNIDAAEEWFTGSLADDRLRAHAEAGLGRVMGQRGDLEAATRHFENAIYLMAWDFRIWMDYAQYWAQQLSTAYDMKARQRIASRLIDSLESALTISEATPELNSLMGFAYLANGEDVLEAIEFLEAAAAAAPHDQASRLLLAQAYLFAYQPDNAIAVAESILRFEHKASPVTAAAQEVIRDARELDALVD